MDRSTRPTGAHARSGTPAWAAPSCTRKNWRLATFASMGAVPRDGRRHDLPRRAAQGRAAHHRGRSAGRGELPRARRPGRLRPDRRGRHLPPAALHRRHARDLVGPRGPQAELARRVHARDAARWPHAVGVRARSRRTIRFGARKTSASRSRFSRPCASSGDTWQVDWREIDLGQERQPHGRGRRLARHAAHARCWRPRPPRR